MPIEVQVDGHGILEFPDDTPDDVIQATVKRVVSAAPDAPAEPSRDWGDTAADMLPTAAAIGGGLLGAVAGPVGAIGGAALGGAGGEGWRRVIQGLRGRRDFAQDSPLTAIRDLAAEGAMQGAGQAVGMGAGAALQKGGRAVYRGLLKPQVGVQREFGGDAVVDTLMREGASISQRGADKVRKALNARTAVRDQMIDDAAPGSTFVDPREILGELRPVIKELTQRTRIGQPSQLRRVGERGRAIVDSLTHHPVDAKGAHELKKVAQKAAHAARRAVERGSATELSADSLVDDAVARGFKKATEARVPGLAEQNAGIQRLIGGSRAMNQALNRGRNNLAIGGARDLIALGGGGAIGGLLDGREGAGAGAGAGLLIRLLASPRGGSNAALLMDRAGRMTPQAALLLRELMASHDTP